jgi:hypothetical protein
MKKVIYFMFTGMLFASCGGQFNDPPKEVIQAEEPFLSRTSPADSLVISNTGNLVEID